MRPVSRVRWATCALTLSIPVAITFSIIRPAAADRRSPIAGGGDPDGSAGAAGGRAPRGIDHRHRSLAECTSFDQADRGDDKVAFTIHNACSVPVDCAVSWRVVCAPDSKKRRASHPSAARLAILDGGSQSAEASAAICGDDAWSIDSVEWSCQPNKD